MDPKDIFERKARRGVGAMEPAPAPGRLDSVNEQVFERAPLPILESGPRVLEFQRKAGSWFGFPYHCLMHIEYEPHARLTLTFAAHEVVIEGRNLKKLYAEILEHRCASVIEMDRATALSTAEDSFEVHRILIDDRSGRRRRKGPDAAPDPD